MVGAALVFIGEAVLEAFKLVVIAHFPVMIIEGIMHAFCVAFFKTS
jgi:hypothetical protein